MMSNKEKKQRADTKNPRRSIAIIGQGAIEKSPIYYLLLILRAPVIYSPPIKTVLLNAVLSISAEYTFMINAQIAKQKRIKLF